MLWPMEKVREVFVQQKTVMINDDCGQDDE